ncbi:MAG: sigma-70 family RNA polymerase sigma factor [Nannocystales bacterium]
MSLEQHPWTSITGDLRRYVARRVPESEVEDVVQDVLLRVVASKDSLSEDRPIAPWVRAVARNAVIDRHRKRTASPPAPDPAVDAEGLTIEAQSEEQRTLLGIWLRVAVDDLPEPYREAVHRVDVLGQSQADVAAALQLPPSTLKSRVQRGRAKLRDSFFRCCDAELDAQGRVDNVRSRQDCPCCDPQR